MTDATRPSPVVDWRDYARQRGLDPMHAWLAVRNAWPTNSTWNRPIRPNQLDDLWADDDMHPVVEAMIDDATRGR